MPDIAWAAGLLEGEGTFHMSDRAIVIGANMIDRDIIERLGRLLGAHVYGPRDRSHIKQTYQPMWYARLKGPGAAAWMMTI